MDELLPGHPKSVFAFFVVEPINEHTRLVVERFVEDLADLREWVNGPPVFIDDVEYPESGRPEELPIVSLGGYLEIYSARGPTPLPRDIDLIHYHEVDALVKAIAELSLKMKLTVEFELDRTFVGTIENGVLDRGVEVVLLAEWYRVLHA